MIMTTAALACTEIGGVLKRMLRSDQMIDFSRLAIYFGGK